MCTGNIYGTRLESMEILLATNNKNKQTELVDIFLKHSSRHKLQFPNKKIIFGPHFSVFPDNKLSYINNNLNNSCYIQPSDWVTNLWKHFNADNILPIKTISFPVDTIRFKPINNERNSVLNFLVPA